MEYRFLGSSGLQVSALSFGSWVTFGTQFGEETDYDCMKAAFEQVTENMQALDVVPKLTSQVMERIEAILGNKPEPQPDFRN